MSAPIDSHHEVLMQCEIPEFSVGNGVMTEKDEYTLIQKPFNNMSSSSWRVCCVVHLCLIDLMVGKRKRRGEMPSR